jgi:hypothetical protein
MGSTGVCHRPAELWRTVSAPSRCRIYSCMTCLNGLKGTLSWNPLDACSMVKTAGTGLLKPVKL